MRCGQCGYGVRGVSTVICPECGADLTKVGITQGGKGRSVLIGSLILVGFTFGTLGSAIVLFIVLLNFIPVYYNQSTSFGVSPQSGEYVEMMVETELTAVMPPGSQSGGFSISYGSLGNTGGTANQVTGTTVLIATQGSKIKIKNLRMELMPKGTAGSVTTFGPRFKIDPDTRQATWASSNGQAQASKSAFTDQDVLDYLAAGGADITRADVQGEAQQLHAALNDLLDGNAQLTFAGFKNSGYGTGGSQSIGPPWFIGVYVLAWIVFWIVGLVLIARRQLKPRKVR